MRILFMGTPELALPSLGALAESEQEVAAVATRPDRPRGRRLAVSPPPVKRRAMELGIRVLQPERASDPAFLDEVARIAPDIITVVAFGAWLPRSLRRIPAKGAINLHPSLLPRYRGGAPVQHAIMNGETETGATILFVDDRMDAGDIIAQECVPIDPDDTCGSLSRKIFERGAALLLEAVRAIEEGRARRVPQDDSLATQAPHLVKSDGLIDWSAPARDISLRVRAFNPWPGAFTYLNRPGGKVMVKIIDAAVIPGQEGEPGRVSRCDARGLIVGTGGGSLLVRRLQPEGRRVMEAGEFTHGYHGIEGTLLG